MEPSGKKKVLIAGGGVAGLEAALALRELADEHVAVELLAPESHFWYKPAAVAAPFEHGDVTRFELSGLARQIGASFTPGGLTGIDAWRHLAYTSKNTQIAYDSLLVACGALPFPSIPGALTFRGPADIELMEQLLQEILDGDVRSVAFVIPWGAVWPLPGYELVLQMATYIRQHGRLEGVELTLVTPEAEPLQLFGAPATRAVHELLEERGVILRTGARAGKFVAGELELIPDERFSVDRVVALPRLQGAPIDGLPQTVHGFIPVDSHCRVDGVPDVFAAGDITSFTVKQGGIAAQQADVAAEAIAAAAGASLVPRPFRPVLRGLLLTGGPSRYLRKEFGVQPERAPVASYEPLWWPPAKIMGMYLAPFLASLAGMDPSPSRFDSASGTVSVEVELEPEALDRLASSRLVLDDDSEAGDIVEDTMSSDPLVVAPEDTLGEVAEHFLSRGCTAAALVEGDRLIGILTTGDLVHAAAMRTSPSEGRAGQWMTADPVTVSVRSTVATAVRLMTEYDIHHVPVVDHGHVVGMLDADDTLRRAEVLPIGLGL